MPQTSHGHIPIYTLIILVSFASVAAVLFTPGLPALQQQFHLNTTQIQSTVSLFLLGYTIGPLIYGPLANRHGRKNMLYCGITIAFIASLFCALSSYLASFKLFLLARFISAIGASAGLTLTFTIVNDVFTDIDYRRTIIAYVTLAFAIMPGLAVSVGGLLVEYLGWQSCFYAFMIYCLGVAFLVSRLPETKPQQLQTVTLKRMLSQYYHVGRDSKLWLYSIMWGSTTGIIYTFSAIAPLISHDNLHLSADLFGFYNLMVFAGLAIGNILSAKLAPLYSSRKVIASGTIVAMSGAFILLLLTINHALTAVYFFLATTWMFIGLPAVFSNASALATARADDKATASSLMNSVDLLIAISVVSLMGLVKNHIALMMSALFLMMLLIVVMLFFLTRTKKLNAMNID
jgi:DHA1 family bicyclomycin/chloramphenicol resistance-like MFS transporter